MRINEIIIGCCNDERDSQAELYKMFYGKMMNICMRYSSNKDEAKDYIQDGFIHIFNKIKTLKSNKIESLGAWVTIVMKNHIIDQIRKKNRFIIDKSVDNVSLDTITDEKDIEPSYINIKFDDIIESIHSLSPKYKLVFNMYVMDNMSHNEISEVLGISVGTSKSNLFKAKRILKKKLLDLQVSV
jgi:RNA polymerase sigma factor (sigma-70 family)